MRCLILAATLAAITSPAHAQPRYTTMTGAVVCSTERGVTDGINLLAKGERSALATIGCIVAAPGRELVPMADGIMDTTVSRVILKGDAGASAQGYIYKESIMDSRTGKAVGAFMRPDY